MQKRRYEILVPLKHNDGRDVDGALIEQTRDELVAEFGAVTLSPSPVLGVWTHEGRRYEDELMRLAVDVEDIGPHREFFTEFKQILLERFDQLDIYITSHIVEVI
jgi:hypothetical protein